MKLASKWNPAQTGKGNLKMVIGLSARNPKGKLYECSRLHANQLNTYPSKASKSYEAFGGLFHELAHFGNYNALL